ncbi:hypothetical protein ACJIZ3_009981 [Penstemon smallii]|uniref:Uncharacterized protein n=1 Tax=Penstemon smallii TaxID=265156 RepID=A0ABD3TEX2_9LAMI
MKKNHNHEEEEEEEHDIELLKAVAQAWHGHSSSSKNTTSTSEFDAHRQYFKGKPTRFKLEAMNMATKIGSSTSWDFGQSLWDSYEIVSVSKKLERGLMMDGPFSALVEQEHGLKKRKESKNSLRNLFNKISSRRFTHEEH